MKRNEKKSRKTVFRRSFLNRDGFWLAVIVVVSLVYLFFAFIYEDTRDWGFDSIRNRLTTLFAIISAIAFWLQFKKSERLNESNYVMNLNNQFINNKNMTKIEHELELYYNQYTQIKKNLKSVGMNNSSMTAADVRTLHLGINLSRTSDDCQMLIDYLVYLEAMAVMVENGVIRIEDVDDLFSYRFFLAVNNPVVQEQELLPFSDFYRGTYNLSQRWVNDHKNKGIPIPMEEFCLTCARLEEWKAINGGVEEMTEVKHAKYEKPHIDCGFARSIDNKKEIALCLYETDPYIYPEAFGDDRDAAVDVLSRIIGMDGSLFDYNNLFLARYNGQVCGVVCLYTGSSKWDKDRIVKRIGPNSLSTEAREEGLEYVSNEYFSMYKPDSLPENTIELVAVCVEEGFRNKGIAKTMMEELFKTDICKDKKIRLTALKDNIGAIQFYEDLKFRQTGEDKLGFGQKGQKPITIEMERLVGS